MAELDAKRIEVLGRSASIIQRKVRSYLARRSFISLRRSVIDIQAACRGLDTTVIFYAFFHVLLLCFGFPSVSVSNGI